MNQNQLLRAFVRQATWRPLLLLLPIDLLAYLAIYAFGSYIGTAVPLALLGAFVLFTILAMYAQANVQRWRLVRAGTTLTPEFFAATVSDSIVSPFDPITTHDLCADALSCVSMARALDYGTSPRFKHDPFRGTMILIKAQLTRLKLFPEAVRIRIDTQSGNRTLVHITRTPGAHAMMPQSGEAARTVAAAKAFIEKTLTERRNALASLRLNEELEKNALQSRLSALQAQVEPHFLYNTLANLRHLIRTDSSRALELLDHMVDYFQVAMPGLRASASTVERELQLASSYLSIMQTRMGVRFSFDTEMGPDTAQLAVPPAMLISLVENAIKHGVEPAQGAVHVRITARREGGMLVLQVRDNGAGLADQPGQGTGLANIQERLRLLYGDAAALLVEPAMPHGVCSSLLLPIAP